MFHPENNSDVGTCPDTFSSCEGSGSKTTRGTDHFVNVSFPACLILLLQVKKVGVGLSLAT